MLSPARTRELQTRSFHATCKCQASVITPQERRQIPPYPYGPSTHYKQRDTGLYGGAYLQYGNSVSEKNEIKNRRVWRLNVHRKRLWSASLAKYMEVKVQARVLRTIDKIGGLDEYLLGNSAARIKELGVEGWALRWKIMQTKAIKERYENERIALGIPREGLMEYHRKETAKARRKALTMAMRYMELQRANEDTKEMKSGQDEDVFEEDVYSIGIQPAHTTSDIRVFIKGVDEEIDALSEALNRDITDSGTGLDQLPLISLDLESSASNEDSNPDTALHELNALLKSVKELAIDAQTTVPSLLAEAGDRLARRAMRVDSQKNGQQLSTTSSSQSSSQIESTTEIDDAVKNEKVNALFRQYEEQLETQRSAFRRDRRAAITIVANRIWTQMKRSRTYVKKSGWDTAWKEALKQTPDAIVPEPVVPEGLTAGQWRYLRITAAQERQNPRARGEPTTTSKADSSEPQTGLTAWLVNMYKGLRERNDRLDQNAAKLT